MYYYNFEVVLQEVPGEISLCFSISGCPLRCQGCHSPFLWKEGVGDLLNKNAFEEILNVYNNLATCVLFMGGEWYEKELIELLKLAKLKNFKTCLYTGKEEVALAILRELTWIKTGKWEQVLGGLNSITTNQKFIEVKTNKNLNYLFIKN
ncbi:anaerobic ribonucleoside-triphosphate reductase activating protein [Flavivirga aquatica]|uniref:Anaerobic ribonucleoside-triphosphate reductase activating protein n=1 Tax=Flavivirga aquatica TaxID=1849968 RepID=A0A1E5T8F6_9FLAO|nr:anaerobic ribonucleoside-triphosphate reductase activating protein [Flavivirga aquatica]OEK07650.1 anaerobic ribonucleoside-triphosphate reductase activating protein [Flavivirga aquatica]